MKKFLWSFFEIAETIVIAIAAVVLIRTYIAQPFVVYGSSMSPNFKNSDYLLVNELTYKFRSPERGEVIVFKAPARSGTYFIKRIVGLPGERVFIDNGKVTIYKNGQAQILHESYLGAEVTSGHYEIVLGLNQYFVMGDNRGASFDSRSWGPLNDSAIIGIAMLRLWPLNKVEAFSVPNY